DAAHRHDLDRVARRRADGRLRAAAPRLRPDAAGHGRGFHGARVRAPPAGVRRPLAQEEGRGRGGARARRAARQAPHEARQPLRRRAPARAVRAGALARPGAARPRRADDEHGRGRRGAVPRCHSRARGTGRHDRLDRPRSCAGPLGGGCRDLHQSDGAVQRSSEDRARRRPRRDSVQRGGRDGVTGIYEWIRGSVQILAYDGYLPQALQYNFVVNALLCSLLIGPVLGAVGTMVVTKLMACFSQAVGNAAMTGVGIGVLLGEPYTEPYVSMFSFCVLFGLLLNYTRNKTRISSDTLIGVFLSISLAV